MFDRELHRLFGGALEMVDGPVFDQTPDGARTKERGGFDRDSCALGNLHDGTNVVFVRSRGAVRLDLHSVGGNFTRQSFGMCRRARPGAREADIDGIDAERLH